MPRLSDEEIAVQLDRIAQLIAGAPLGLNRHSIASEYLKAHGQTLASRTLQRRLTDLVVADRIAYGPGTLYRSLADRLIPDETEEGYPPLSAEGTKVRSLVRRPIGEKIRIGYNPDWLSEYQPGRTWYLPKSLRADLLEKGSTPGDNRPAGTFARDILGRLLIDLSWASSRLEGNTYTRLDTQNLLEFGQRAEGKDAAEAQMILNHKAAIELLVSGADYIGFNRTTLLNLHAALSENLLGSAADEGSLRQRPVDITGTAYTPTAIPQVIQECFDRMLDLAGAIPDPFEQAFFVMVHIPYLQPFIDVNKRTSRLAANISLIRGNLCPLSFIDVPERAYVEGTLGVYEHRRIGLLRDVFAFAYERSCAQYRVVRGSMPAPDSIRLRYRRELANAVAGTIRAGAPPKSETLWRWAQEAGVPADDLEAFATRALDLLLNIHEGSAGRFQLRPGEVTTWKKGLQPS